MQKPNILFLLPDQHRPDWLGCNKSLPLRTPNIDKLCENGVRFTNCFTPSPLCAPARACLATGRDYHRCGVINNNQNTPLSLPTYYQYLRDAGYEVCGVGKFDLHKADNDQGLDGQNLIKEYGFTCGIDNEGKWDAIISYRRRGNKPGGPYMNYLQSLGLAEQHANAMEKFNGPPFWGAWINTLPEEAYCDNWVAENGIKFLKNFPKNKPWHLVVNFTCPHEPFDVTPDMRKRWENAAIPDPVDSNRRDIDIEAIKNRRQNYAAMIENIDRHIGRIISLVKEREELENTIIIYSSDHGEMLGDHGRWHKGVWYTPSAGVPLIISGPGIIHGYVSNALVSLHDLAATLLDYAGTSQLPHTDARSLRQILEGQTSKHRDFIISALNQWKMIFDGNYKYVVTEGKPDILYDIKNDPFELNNIALSAPEICKKLFTLLNLKKGQRL